MYPLYENIKRIRKQCGLSQEQLAQMVGYADKSMICKIEQGEVDLPYSKILALADALQASPSELMGWSGQGS